MQSITHLIPLLLFSCCAPTPDQPVRIENGAFTTVDRGESAGMDRYRIELSDPLDLNLAGVSRYVLDQVPQVELVLYLDLAHRLPTGGATASGAPWSATVVELRIEDGGGEVVARERAPLSDWTWSGSVGGSTSSLYTSNTVFTPSADGPYFLVTEVEPAGSGAPAATVSLRGGGWKAEGKPMPTGSIFR